MAQPSAYEQYMLELVNRARRAPSTEAAQYGINLNQGLAPGTISNSAKQPLAFNFDLIDSSRSHSNWMLDTDTFSHTGVNGSNPGDRMRAADYQFTGSWTWGENLAWRGTTGTPNVTSYVAAQHEGLFKSPGHRTNTLNGSFKEIGIGVRTGDFDGYNAVMVTQNFAKSGSSSFLTGVAFDDSVTDDDFYTVGEGLGSIQVTATRQSDKAVFQTSTYGSGGYQIALTPGDYDVTFTGGGLSQTIQETVSIGSSNVKLDLATDELPTTNSRNSPANAIGEYGAIALNHQWQTVALDASYINPVVIVSDPTSDGGDPAIARLRNVTGDTFQIRLQEPGYADGQRSTESVSYMVVEAGDWTLADGTQITAGTYDSNRLTSAGFDTVGLDFDTTPTVLSQVQTYNGSDWVTTRTKDQSARGFRVAMQEEEARNGGSHLEETVGWFAIEQGVTTGGDPLIQAGSTDQTYSHQRSTVDFETAFEAAPALIAKLGSYYGGDTANVQIDDIESTGFGVTVREEQSLDSETSHINEAVAFLALAGESGTLNGAAA